MKKPTAHTATPTPRPTLPQTGTSDGEGGPDVFVSTESSGTPSPSGRGPGGGVARLAILLSGRGSNMVALVTAAQTGILHNLAEVAVVFSNHPAAPGLATAAALACPTTSLSSQGRQRADYDAEVVEILRQYRPDYVVLAGYMRILSPTFVRAFAGRILNIHPADTHQHQGLHAYEWAFDNQLLETKITVHLVDEGLDTGPILAQQTVDLRGAETLAEVERRGLLAEHQLYAKALAALLRKELKIEN